MVSIGSGAQREVEDWNPGFNSGEFAIIKSQAGRNSFFQSGKASGIEPRKTRTTRNFNHKERKEHKDTWSANSETILQEAAEATETEWVVDSFSLLTLFAPVQDQYWFSGCSG